MLDISQAKINPLNKTMIKKVQLQFELELEEVSIVKFKRTFRGKKYRYPIVMSCLAIMQMGVQVPIGIRISVYEVASISSKNLFLSISPGMHN